MTDVPNAVVESQIADEGCGCANLAALEQEEKLAEAATSEEVERLAEEINRRA